VQAPAGVSDSAIVATVRDVFAAPAFNPARSIWWWTEYIDIPFDREIARRVLLIIVITMVVITLLRHAHRYYLERQYGDVLGGSGGARGRARDPWVAAQELAAGGDFTSAAHALYLALLDALARRDQVRLHPSKTVGDYLRELRTRSSALLPTFRDFARLYERVIYGFRECDAERYARLHALASAMIQPNE
jgi:hypothetical protein